ncbi:leucyl aminopeptidase [Actinocatenispora sera]|uniref:leucyl aminopeptidase n=1 Tax=Actinocatenispora sera TaxID=390989 RepID=UPI003F4D70DD
MELRVASLTLRLGTGTRPAVLAVPVAPTGDDTDDSAAGPGSAGKAGSAGGAAAAVLATVPLPAGTESVLAAYLADVEHSGAAGSIEVLPRPGERPQRLIAVGVGDGTEADWRAAGAAVVRAAAKQPALTVAVPDGLTDAQLAGLAEGILLAGYRFSLAADDSGAPALNRVTIAADAARYGPALAHAQAVAEVTALARDWVNTPSNDKSPEWFAGRIARAAEKHQVQVRIRDAAALAAEGFGGVVAVGEGSPRPPRLVELRWRPRGAQRHVVLVGKGITYDTGGIDIKPIGAMELMRKDMGGAGAVAAATIGAAAMRLPVRVTALLPLADNVVSGAAYRPGDVVRHYGGITTEIQNTDAEGRIVVADALAYAVRRLAPDVLVDLATLTGAQRVALGKKTAALYATDDELAAALAAAGDDAGEPMWRMPLPADYVEKVHSSTVADLNNAPVQGEAGSVMGALFLREFTAGHPCWAHVDMSAPAWSASAAGELPKGATGWGVRTLLRYLATQ